MIGRSLANVAGERPRSERKNPPNALTSSPSAVELTNPRRHWNATDVAQIFDQLPNGPCIATPDAAATSRQELTCMVPSEDIQLNIVFLHPKAEILQEIILLTYRHRVIALVREPCREPVKVCGQSTDAEGCGQRRRTVV